MQAKLLQNLFGIVRQLFVLVVRSLGLGEFHQLHFLKLMLADDAADIFAVGSGLAAEAGRVGGERDRQPRGVEDFVAVEIGDWNLGRRNQPQIFVSVRNPKEISGKLWELPGAV